MTDTLEAVQKVQSAPPDVDVRIIRRIEVGSATQQGDLYVHRVADTHPRGEQIGKGVVQVALGTNNGARHVAEGEVEVFAGVKLPAGVRPPLTADAKEITGPVVVAKTTWMLTHPEHAHHQLPAGTYQVTYQYDPRTMRRVAD